MKKIIFLILTISSFAIFGQRKFSKEISFINDNDLYTSIYQDRYYTNGMFLAYSYLTNSKKNNVEKKVFNFEVSQLMYSQSKANVKTISEHDRPFAAYLYGAFGIDYFYKNNSILKLKALVGTIGPSAGGRKLMSVIHDIYGFEEATGWKHQIKDGIGLNLNASYIKNLWIDNAKTLDISWCNNANLGTVFTDIETGFYTRIGFKPMQDLVNSIAFGGNFNSSKTAYNNEIEVFFYAQPTVKYVHYDATIQGSFLNKGSEVTYEVENFQYGGDFGLRFTSNRWNLGYSVIFHSKKLKSIRVPNTNFYGRITVNYQFN